MLAVYVLCVWTTTHSFNLLRSVFFFNDPLNWINFGGCVIVLCGVVLYKVTFHLDKERTRAIAAATLEKDPENANDEKRERQPLRHANDGNEKSDDGVSKGGDTNGYSDSSESSIEMRRSIDGQYDGIEMRQSITRKRGTGGSSTGSDKEEALVETEFT